MFFKYFQNTVFFGHSIDIFGKKLLKKFMNS